MSQLRFALIVLCLLHLTNAAEAWKRDPEFAVTPHAKYELRQSLSDESFTCMFKNNVQLTCIENDTVRFGQKISTKDYLLLPIYDSCAGNSPACDRSGTTLLIESGKETSISIDVKEYCLECSKSVDVSYDQNEVRFMLDRVDGKFKVAARFKDGSMLVGKSALRENESIKADECDWLYGEFLEGCKGESGAITPGSRRCVGVKDRMAMVYVRSLEAFAREYAGFPTNDLDRICDAVCTSGKKPGRAQFDRRICRR